LNHPFDLIVWCTATDKSVKKRNLFFFCCSPLPN